jgi:hypothetical protein
MIVVPNTRRKTLLARFWMERMLFCPATSGDAMDQMNGGSFDQLNNG